jgi:hypothetical protein
METMLNADERGTPDDTPEVKAPSLDEQRARRSVALAMRIVGPPDAGTVRNLE